MADQVSSGPKNLYLNMALPTSPADPRVSARSSGPKNRLKRLTPAEDLEMNRSLGQDIDFARELLRFVLKFCNQLKLFFE